MSGESGPIKIPGDVLILVCFVRERGTAELNAPRFYVDIKPL